MSIERVGVGNLGPWVCPDQMSLDEVWEIAAGSASDAPLTQNGAGESLPRDPGAVLQPE